MYLLISVTGSHSLGGWQVQSWQGSLGMQAGSVWWQNSFFFRKPQLFVLRPSANCTRPTDLRESKVLHLKLTPYRCLHLQNTLRAIPRLILIHMTEHLSLVYLTHKAYPLQPANMLAPSYSESGHVMGRDTISNTQRVFLGDMGRTPLYFT